MRLVCTCTCTYEIAGGKKSLANLSPPQDTPCCSAWSGDRPGPGANAGSRVSHVECAPQEGREEEEQRRRGRGRRRKRKRWRWSWRRRSE